MISIKLIHSALIGILLFSALSGCTAMAAPTPIPAQATIVEATIPTQVAPEQATLPPLEPVPPTAEPTAPLDQPTLENTPVIIPTQPSGPPATLGFLKNGNVWLAQLPEGTLRQVTQSGDLLSFAWSPDGAQLATFNGRSLCFITPDGSPAQPCLALNVDDNQALVERRIQWSPDQRSLVLWNSVNPWDESAIGWLIVMLDGSGATYVIEDPVDWGVGIAPNNEPGGITGQPVFLGDNSLLGSLTHRWLCGSGGCHYQLYRFDFQARSFAPYPNKPDEGWSEGGNLVLSKDRRLLVNFGSFYSSCESYVTFVDIFDLANQSRQAFNLDMEALSGLALSPDSSQAVIARVAGCSNDNPDTWDRACGLSQGFDIHPMQLWNFASDQRSDLLPGTSPQWSPDGGWISFRSCLVQNASGGWETSPAGPPLIYVSDPNGGGLRLVADGATPAWKP